MSVRWNGQIYRRPVHHFYLGGYLFAQALSLALEEVAGGLVAPGPVNGPTSGIQVVIVDLVMADIGEIPLLAQVLLLLLAPRSLVVCQVARRLQVIVILQAVALRQLLPCRAWLLLVARLGEKARRKAASGE